MQVKTLEISGFNSAIRAMRLPMKSGEKSDTTFGFPHIDVSNRAVTVSTNAISIGKNDLELATKLIKAGDEHAKVFRGIVVHAEIDAPRFWWQEMDTYRFGTDTLSSESTMHRIMKDNLSIDDFEIERDNLEMVDFINLMIKRINGVKQSTILADTTKLIWIKSLLSESFLQTRIKTFTYQTLRRIRKQRRPHRLPQWQIFCDWIETLPMAKELIICSE